jgi:hypothetical protein
MSFGQPGRKGPAQLLAEGALQLFAKRFLL